MQGELAFADSDPAFEPQTITRYRVALVREESTPYDEPQSCSDPRSAARFVQQVLSSWDREVMGAIYLDIRNRAIGHQLAYVGTLTGAAVEPRGILTAALLSNAAGLILFHNHPSGDPSPSAEDLAGARSTRSPSHEPREEDVDAFAELHPRRKPQERIANDHRVTHAALKSIAPFQNTEGGYSTWECATTAGPYTRYRCPPPPHTAIPRSTAPIIAGETGRAAANARGSGTGSWWRFGPSYPAWRWSTRESEVSISSGPSCSRVASRRDRISTWPWRPTAWRMKARSPEAWRRRWSGG